MTKAFSKFHKLEVCDGLEALRAEQYHLAFPFHFHQTYNISLVYAGIFRTKLGDRELQAPAGSLLITNPLEIHANPVETHESVSFFTFYISPAFFNRSRQQPIFFEDHVVYDDSLFQRLHAIAVQLEAGVRNPEQELAAALSTLAAKHALPEKVGCDASSSFVDDFLARPNADHLSLDQLSKQFGINKYKFLRLFKFQTGLTPHHYFLLKRIEKSKEMLVDGRDLLTTAIDLGFYDIPHFSNYFKKFTGISPSAYSVAVNRLGIPR